MSDKHIIDININMVINRAVQFNDRAASQTQKLVDSQTCRAERDGYININLITSISRFVLCRHNFKLRKRQ